MISKLFNLKSIYEDDEDILLFWQKKIFKYLYITLLAVGIFPYATSLTYSIRLSRWDLIAVFSFVYAWGFCVTFLERIPFRARVWAGVGAFYFLGVVSLFHTGLVSSARLYLICFCALAAIFLNLKGGLICLLINIVTLVFLGLSLDYGPLFPVLMTGITGQHEWFVFTTTFCLLSAALTISLGILIHALEVSGKEFKYLIKNSTDVIWKLDSSLNTVFINSAILSGFGYQQNEWINKPFLQFFSKTDQNRFKVVLEKNGAFDIETTLTCKDGRQSPVEITGIKVRHFSGKKTMYQGIIRDITEKKKRQKEKQLLEERLFQAEKLKALGLLAGSVAHDLNNILSGIATYPEVLLMDGYLDPEVEKGLKIIRDSGLKASAVVSDLLTISRGAITEKETVNMNMIIDGYITSHDFKKIQETHPLVSVAVEKEPELLNMKGSYIHIEKMIMNLMINAIEEVSGRENGQVIISTANAYLDETEGKNKSPVRGEYILLKVTDNGSGIDEKDRSRIFDPFYTKKQMGKSGTGLGLAVVWNAVQDHDGSIEVISGPEGTVFEMMFPASRKNLSDRHHSASFEDIQGQGQVILVVDDLKDQQKIALSILEKLGYQASAVDNGYKAVDFIKNRQVDLVILDMIMAPSVSGLETFKMIKEINSVQKAIIASGFAESQDVLDAQQLGAGSFVKKPYTIMDMGTAVKKELEK